MIASILATIWFPVRDWTITVFGMRLGVQEFAYPTPQGPDGILNETWIVVGERIFDFRGVSLHQTGAAGGVVAVVLIAFATFLVMHRRGSRISRCG